MHDLVTRLVTFSSLFEHNLLSLHDVDFYATGTFIFGPKYASLVYASWLSWK